VGWVVPPAQPDRLVETILEAWANPDLIVNMGRRARRVVEEKYALPQVLAAYRTLIRSLHDV